MIKLVSYIFSLFFTVTIFYSCSKSDDAIVNPGDDTSTNFKYPYSLNSNWFFTTTHNYTFHPDTIKNYMAGLDSSVESGYAVWKNDTVINGITARVLRGNHTSVVHSYNTSEYYVQTDTGLVNIGYIDDYGTGFGPFRPGVNVYPSKHDKYNFLNNFRGGLFNDISYGSDVSKDHVICLRYPIVENREWFFRNISDIQTQRKKYLGYEQIRTPAGTYNCIKIQRKNYTGNPEVLDTNYISYDYFSKVGMVKRSVIVKNNPAYNRFNGDLIGFYDIGFEVILNSVNIIP